MKVWILFSTLLYQLLFPTFAHTTSFMGKRVASPSFHKAPLMAKTIAPSTGKTTQPMRLHVSDREKRCPNGFQFSGKQCMQTVYAPAEIVCPPGTSQEHGQCATLVGKHPVCPAGFDAYDGVCTRVLYAPVEVTCPEGFVLLGQDQCVQEVQAAPHAVCPSGSVATGDGCVQEQHAAPTYLCNYGSKQEGNRCIREENCSCNPPRKGSSRHFDAGGKKGGEYVLRSCKRIISEPARKVCENGRREGKGKGCIFYLQVEPLIVPGAFTTLTVPATRHCPMGFSFSVTGDTCVQKESEAPLWICPPNTTELNESCAIWQSPNSVCPLGFTLDHDTTQCVKTVVAAPITEYTVTYICKGKNCDQNYTEH